MLRFDGLYISKLPADYGAMVSYSYLRFYGDGAVIECTIRGEQSTEVFSWFDRSDETLSLGRYNVSSNTIEFFVRSNSGVVDYNGQIVGDELHLNSFSHINGNQSEDEYAFFQVN